MATLDQLERAFIAADDAGNTDDAAAFAAEIRKMREASTAAPAQPQAKSGVGISDIGRWVAKPYMDLGNLVAEVPAALVTGFGSTLAGNIMGAGSDLYSAATGQPKVGEQVRSDVDFTYRPRSDVAKEFLNLLSKGIESNAGKVVQGLPIAGQELPMLTRAAKQGIPASLENFSAKLSAPSEKVLQVASQNPEMVEAAKKLRAMNLVADPGQVNPTFKNIWVTGFARPEIVDIKASKINMPRVRNYLIDIAGIEGNQLTNEAFENARASLSRPYNAVKQIGQLKPNADIASSIRSSVPSPITGLEDEVKKITKQITRVAEAVDRGELTADQVIKDIRGYRSKAQNFYKLADKGDAKRNPAEMAKAYQKLADTLEDYIASNLPEGSKLLDDFVSARQKLAQNYTVESLVNTESGVVDLSNFNKPSVAGAPLTGVLADLKTVYSNFPEAFQTLDKYGDSLPKTISRSSAGGTAGAALGMATGVSPGLGGILGAMSGLVGGRQAANMSVSPAYQAKNLIPNIPGPRRLAPQGFTLAPRAIPPLNLPTKEQPLSIPEAPPLVPGSWRMPLTDQPQNIPLPAIGDLPDIAPVPPSVAIKSSSQGAYTSLLSDYPVGSQATSPLPTLPPATRGLLGLSDDSRPIPDTQRLATRHDVPTIEFKLRQEVLQNPEIMKSTQAFIAEAERLRDLINKSQGMWKNKYRQELTALENEFSAGMRQLGIDNPQDAIGLAKLYKGGGETKLKIEKVRGLK